MVDNYTPAISIITEIELLCWKHATQADISNIKSFIDNAIVLNLDQTTKSKTIQIRKDTSLKLPDAVIAATAMSNNLILISRNTVDFKKVNELNFVDLFNL